MRQSTNQIIRVFIFVLAVKVIVVPMLDAVIGPNAPKIIVTVRNIIDTISSFVYNPVHNLVDGMSAGYFIDLLVMGIAFLFAFLYFVDPPKRQTNVIVIDK